MIFAGLDTALVNAGLVICDDQGRILYSGKPFPKKQFKGDEDSLFQTHRRIRETAHWVTDKLGSYRPSDIFVAIEDYLMTGYSRSYKIAELNSLLKEWLWDFKIRYCLVHPKKTLKYVVKRREVPKSDIIEYVKKEQPEVYDGVDRADYSDIADAWVICQIGRMVHEAMLDAQPGGYVLSHPLWEIRWKELLATDESGIVTKTGLVQWEYSNV
jgi:hypothetical protein